MKIKQKSIEEGQNLFQELVEKAWDSTSFKNQLISNPKSVITEVSGKDLKLLQDKKIVVEDQTDKSIIYLNIPAKLTLDDLELTDKQMEVMSGGDNIFFDLGYCYINRVIDDIQWVGDQFTR